MGSTTIRKCDPENISVAVGISSLCALELGICLGVGLFFTPPHRCRQMSQKTVAEKRVKIIERLIETATHSREYPRKPYFARN